MHGIFREREPTTTLAVAFAHVRVVALPGTGAMNYLFDDQAIKIRFLVAVGNFNGDNAVDIFRSG